MTSPDTIFEGPSPGVFDVRSLTFTASGDVAEFYFSNPGRDTTLLSKIDRGQWTLADSVVNLTIANSYPHKLTYRYATDELVTDVNPKMISQEFLDGSIGTISYSTQIGYRRSPWS